MFLIQDVNIAVVQSGQRMFKDKFVMFLHRNLLFHEPEKMEKH